MASIHCAKLETPMNLRYLATAFMAAGLLIAAPAFAQTSSAQKQPTQEGGGDETPCGLPWHANASADPNCRQQTQSLTPLPVQGSQESTGHK
jgi:hypothetical protein